MKTIFLNLALVIIVFASCSQKDNQETAVNDIVGKWKLIAINGSDGSTSEWVDVTSDCVVQFLSNNAINTFNCEQQELFLIGSSYEILDDNTLKINSSFKVGYYLSDNQLILDGGGYGCDETCASKYTKIIDE